MDEEGIVVVSCFDGMACARIALERLGIKVKRYYAFEIDKYAMQVAKANYPDIIHLGDIRNASIKDLGEERIDLICGGSPCQGFSFAGKQLAFDDPRSKLFFEFVRLVNECKELNPDVLFLLENVKMKQEYELVISKYMGVSPIEINAALVSAQNRRRNFWTNINNKPIGLFGDMYCDIPQPKDRGILLKDILQPENEVDDKYYLSEKASKYLDRAEINKRFVQNSDDDKGNCVTANYQKGLPYNVLCDNKSNCITSNYPNLDTRNYIKGQGELVCVAMRGRGENNEQQLEENKTGKTNSLTSVQKDNLIMQVNPSLESGGKQPYQQNRVYDTDGISPALMAQMSSGTHAIKHKSRIRRLTPIECCRLQSIPDHIITIMLNCGVSDSQIYKMLGNGWNIEVIVHILSYAPFNKKQ